MSQPIERKLVDYVVRFYSGLNLHSSAVVSVEHVADAVDAAVEKLGEEVRTLPAAVTTTDGNGVAELTNDVATKADLQRQLESIQKQLGNITDASEPPQQAPPPVVNPGFQAPPAPQTEEPKGE